MNDQESNQIKINRSTAAAFASVADGASAFNTVSSPTYSTFTSHAASNARVKTGYTDCDYRSYRDHEALPVGDREMMKYGDDAYYKVGIVRNIVDLMSDFITKGIRWEHSNRNVEAFYNSWFRECKGLEVSERFCSYLLRMGNCVIFPIESKIQTNLAKEWKKTRGSEFGQIDFSVGKITSQYTFINPLSLTNLTQDLGNFIGKRVYTLSVPATIQQLCASYLSGGRNMNSQLQSYISSVPRELMKKIIENKGVLTFTDDELIVEHYRKDDWSAWARPMISSIFPQLVMLEKMHLADMSALDGAISNIRLWSLGFIDPKNINNSYIPSPDTLRKVRDLIHNNVAGGVLDLVWGPELTFKESSTQVHNFLGPEKYTQVMNEIYDGLGIPPTLSGSASSGGGFTNNFISMKVLVDRLNYLRQKLVRFWRKEAKKIQKTMGFSSPAILTFDDAIVSDEGQYKKLLLDMYDRDLVDSETVLNQFNMHSKVVQSRIKKEMKSREKFKSPQKAGPFHNPMWLTQLHSELVKTDKVDDELLPFDVEPDAVEEVKTGLNQNKPTNPDGRPSGTKDQTKRKSKIVRPRTAAFINIQDWARGAYSEISEIVTPAYLAQHNKTSVRQLTAEQLNQLEDFKLTVLGNHPPFSNITDMSVANCCSDLKGMSICIAIRNELLRNISSHKENITIEDKRIASCTAYAFVNIK